MGEGGGGDGRDHGGKPRVVEEVLGGGPFSWVGVEYEIKEAEELGGVEPWFDVGGDVLACER